MLFTEILLGLLRDAGKLSVLIPKQHFPSELSALSVVKHLSLFSACAGAETIGPIATCLDAGHTLAMNNLADAVLDYYWFLNFSTDEEAEMDTTVELMEVLSHQIENEFSEGEKQALMDAARRRLGEWLREPDEHGYTPRQLLSDEQKEFLEEIARGEFS